MRMRGNKGSRLFLTGMIGIACILSASGCRRMSETQKEEMLGKAEIIIMQEQPPEVREDRLSGNIRTTEEYTAAADTEGTGEDTSQTGQKDSGEGKDRDAEALTADMLSFEYVSYDFDAITEAFYPGQTYRKADEWLGVQFLKGEDGSVLEIQKPMVVYKKTDDARFYSKFRSWTVSYETTYYLQPCHLESSFPAEISPEEEAGIREICDSYLAKTGFEYSRADIYRIDHERGKNGFFTERTDLEEGEKQYLVIYQAPVVEGLTVEEINDRFSAKILYSNKKGILFLTAYATHLYATSHTEVPIISREEALGKVSSLAAEFRMDPNAIVVTDCRLAYASPDAGEEHWTLQPVWKICFRAKPGMNPYPNDAAAGCLILQGDHKREGWLLLDAQTGDIGKYNVNRIVPE